VIMVDCCDTQQAHEEKRNTVQWNTLKHHRMVHYPKIFHAKVRPAFPMSAPAAMTGIGDLSSPRKRGVWPAVTPAFRRMEMPSDEP
jgi:hypothetical protein